MIKASKSHLRDKMLQMLVHSCRDREAEARVANVCRGLEAEQHPIYAADD